MFEYRTYFRLKADVRLFEEAQAFLKNYNLTATLKNTSEFVEYAKCELVTTNAGYVGILTNDLLSQEESKKISAKLSQEFENGIGKQFEQRSFAYHLAPGAEDDPFDDSARITASFDFQTNMYELKRLGEER